VLPGRENELLSLAFFFNNSFGAGCCLQRVMSSLLAHAANELVAIVVLEQLNSVYGKTQNRRSMRIQYQNNFPFRGKF
jgi:hypothetical protein